MSWRPPQVPPRRDDPAWRPVMVEILDQHQISTVGLRPEGTGSAVVWGTDEVVVKLTRPRWAADIERERLWCRHGVPLSVQVPRVLGHGERSGWPYVLLSRLRGVPLDAAWAALEPAQRVDGARRLGALVAELQALPLPTVDDPP